MTGKFMLFYLVFQIGFLSSSYINRKDGGTFNIRSNHNILQYFIGIFEDETSGVSSVNDVKLQSFLIFF